MILHIIGMIGVDGALYKSMEFVGEGIKNLTMDDRFTIANMAIEAGGKNGIFPVDELTEAYMKEHSKRPYKVYEADEDAVYDAEYTIDLSTLEPTVAFPHLPENTRTISEIKEDIAVDQSVIGFLYKRTDRRSENCSGSHEGTQSTQRSALYRDPCYTGSLSSGHGRRTSENLY